MNGHAAQLFTRMFVRGNALGQQRPMGERQVRTSVATALLGALTGVLALVVTAMGSMPAYAQEKPKAMLILDASLRMLQPFGETTKLQATANASSVNFKRYRGKVLLGLASFGNRNAEACADYKVAQPPAPIDPAALDNVIQKFTPRGGAAIAQVLDLAARTMGSEGDRSIVLVSGGADTCQADPCAIAKLLSETGGLTVHVVALAGGEGAVMRQLKCVADRTGGSFRRVKTEAELTEAIDHAFAAIVAGKKSLSDPNSQSSEEGASASTAWSAETKAATAAQSEAGTAGFSLQTEPMFTLDGKAKVSVSMTALLTDAGPQIGEGVIWRIYQVPATDESASEPAVPPRLVAVYREPSPAAQLPPGAYLVNVAFGKAHATRRITVVDGQPSTELFVLNAGGIRIKALGADGQPIPADALTTSILSFEELDPLGNSAVVASDVRPNLTTRLNSGLYRLVSRYGDANAVVLADVSVEAGKITEVVIRNDGARLSFKLVSEAGSEALAGTRWRITDSEGVLVKESVGALPTHILAPGRYTVEAQRAGQSFADQIVVEPGATRTVEILVDN